MNPSTAPLHLSDFVIMAVYFAAMIGIGVWFFRRSTTTEGYFLGDGSAPSWVLGLSMVAAKISSVTFLALPAAAFVLDWRMFVPNLVVIPVALVAIWILVPFFRRAAHTTAFEYLNARFGAGARLYGAFIFLFSQAFRLGAIIYLVSIPIQMFTGLSPLLIMAVVGGLCTLYTILGGIQAVIWTDAIQAIVLYLGGLAALVVMILGIPGGLGEIFHVAIAEKKFSLGPMGWDFNDRTFWTMLIIGATGWIGQYTSDQVLIQRYLAAKDLRQARMAGWTSAFLCLPTWAFFYFLGTALYVFYKVSPDPAIAEMPVDNVFPYFILSRMPHGLSGLVVAGVLSAAMGSLSAALNAFATVATVDVLKPYVFRNRGDRFYARAAKVLTGGAAVIMFTAGWLFSVADKESFLDFSQQIMGLIGGVIPGIFLLGFFAPRVGKRVLWQAFAAASLLNLYFVLVQFHVIAPVFGMKVHPYWVSTVVILVMLLLAIILAWIQRTTPDLRPGLTVYHPLQTPAPREPETEGEIIRSEHA